MASSQALETYKDTLDSSHLQRYILKTSVIGVDPYCVKNEEMLSDVDSLPAVSYFDIVNYFINTKSAYTMEDLNAVKSMDSFNHCYNGWVKDVRTMRRNDLVLVKGRVRHSQRMNGTPLSPWAIVTPSGNIKSAHCNCMAGLGEACSHIGALLFWVETTHRANASPTVTQKKAYWPVPSYVDKVQYAEIQDIDFTSAEKKIKDFNNVLGGENSQRRSCKLPNVPVPSMEEERKLAEALHKAKCKPAVLAVKQDFQTNYIPDILKDGKLPISLATLRDDKFMTMTREELINKCHEIMESSLLRVTEEQSRNAELLTKQQSACKEWHEFRHGRITASNTKLVCRGSVDKPAVSTIKAICGTGGRFKSKSTSWGLAHEQDALSQYKLEMSRCHDNLSVEKSGLFVSSDKPHLGASPDGLVSCGCCGDGLVEVKCPFSFKDSVATDVAYLDKDKTLKLDHGYMFQVQTQLLVTKRLYCDFVVWTKHDCSIQRIQPIPEIQAEIADKTAKYFESVILPELTGCLISRESLLALKENNSVQTLQLPPDSDKSAELVCVCKQPYKEGEHVIGCDDENCPYVWLHFTCIGLTKVPRGKYFCDECRVKQPKTKRKKATN